MISVGKKPDGSHKDTRATIEQRRDFVVHIAHRSMLEDLNESAATLPASASEVDLLGPATEAFNVTLGRGAPLTCGKKVTAFINSEERAANLDQAMPFLLTSRLRGRFHSWVRLAGSRDHRRLPGHRTEPTIERQHHQGRH